MQIFHKSYFQFVIKYSSQNYISRISTFKIEIEFRSVVFQLSGANLACKSDQLTKKKKKTKMKRFSIDCLTSLSRTLFSNSRQVSHEEGIEESGWRQQCDCCL